MPDELGVSDEVPLPVVEPVPEVPLVSVLVLPVPDVPDMPEVPLVSDEAPLPVVEPVPEVPLASVLVLPVPLVSELPLAPVPERCFFLVVDSDSVVDPSVPPVAELPPVPEDPLVISDEPLPVPLVPLLLVVPLPEVELLLASVLPPPDVEYGEEPEPDVVALPPVVLSVVVLCATTEPAIPIAEMRTAKVSFRIMISYNLLPRLKTRCMSGQKT